MITLSRLPDGVWEGMAAAPFATFMSLPYMYRFNNAQNRTVYRTDIFSRSQIGKGDMNLRRRPGRGRRRLSTAHVSCSVVIDADVIRREFASTPPGRDPDLIPVEEFWATEFTPGLPVPTRLEDLVIYELHVGSLGFGKPGAGDLSDAVRLIDHLRQLGVNAVELLPHGGIRRHARLGLRQHPSLLHRIERRRSRQVPALRARVPSSRHRGHPGRGLQPLRQRRRAGRMAIRLDRAGRQHLLLVRGTPLGLQLSRSRLPVERRDRPHPAFLGRDVRQQFISGAAFLIEEMHVDGLRVDLTQAMHRDNVLEGSDHRSIGSANIFGQKLLREWSRTLHMIKPTAMLIAEDHTGWDAVTKPPAQGGLGFDAHWEVGFYHSLIGDADMAGDRSRLLKRAGFGGNEALGMDAFSGALYRSRYKQVVFHESHDEAGNAGGTARTIVTAVNGAPLFGATRVAAEARCSLLLRPVPALGGDADVLHGRGDRGAERLQVRQHPAQPRGHPRRAQRQRPKAVSFLSGSHHAEPPVCARSAATP